MDSKPSLLSKARAQGLEPAEILADLDAFTVRSNAARAAYAQRIQAQRINDLDIGKVERLVASAWRAAERAQIAADAAFEHAYEVQSVLDRIKD